MKKFILSLILSLCLFGAFAEGHKYVDIMEKSNDFCSMAIHQMDDKYYFITLLTTDREYFGFNLTTDLKDCMICFNEEWPKLIDDPDIRDKVLQQYRESATEVSYRKDKDLVFYCIENK